MTSVAALDMKPLFIALKGEFYDDFINENKDTEYRIYGPRWNERTCPVGRRVVISRGYGKRYRSAGTIIGFKASHAPTWTDAWRRCYGDKSRGKAACIQIKLDDVCPHQ